MFNKYDSRGRERKFINYHESRISRRPRWKDAVGERGSRKRARKLNKPIVCFLEDKIGHCQGRLEVHHKDKNDLNNAPENLCTLCRSHHHLVDAGTVSLENPVMPKYRIWRGQRLYYEIMNAKARARYWAQRGKSS